MLDIKTESNPILREKCHPVEKFDDELRLLLKEMIKAMNINQGIGLAGPQVGELKNLFVIDAGRGPLIFINPEITERSEDETAMIEGCLSLPGVELSVKRPKEIKIKYQDEYGKHKELSAKGLTAKVIQHEYDHLIGKLITDYQDMWDRLRERGSKILNIKQDE